MHVPQAGATSSHRVSHQAGKRAGAGMKVNGGCGGVPQAGAPRQPQAGADYCHGNVLQAGVHCVPQAGAKHSPA